MMSFQQEALINDPLAAALAAALASNGGTFLYDSTAAVPNASSDHGMKSSALSLSSPTRSFSSISPIHITSSSSSSNIDCCDQDQDDDDTNNSGTDSGNHHDNDTTSGNEEDAKRRMARSRERNREHARRTRRRKKAQLEALQSKVQCLQAQNKTLKQSLEECRIASILVGFSVSDGDDRDATIQLLLKEANEIEGKGILKRLVGGKRTRFVSDASDIASNGTGVATSVVSGSSVSVPLKIEINGQTTLIGGDDQSHLNWKTGVYTDENGVRSLLTNKQLESLRRERNRMHAKMTRDRKKTFIAAIEKTIEELESSNKRMNAVLEDVVTSQKSSTHADILVSSEINKINNNSRQVLPLPGITPSTSPETIPRKTWGSSVPELMPALPISPSKKCVIHTVMAPLEDVREQTYDLSEEEESHLQLHLPPKKRVCHGFSLPY